MSDPQPVDPSTSAPAPAPASWRERIDLLTQAPALTPARVVGGAAALVAALVLAWFLLRTPTGPPTEEVLPLASAGAGVSSSATTASTSPAALYVHAAGAVAHPGVYRLPPGARVTDVLDAAGGPTPDADVDQLNLAAPVSDGERIYVPRVGESVAVASAASSSAPVGPLDLNTATLEQLDALPGIGPTTAQAIIDERDRRGGFRSVDDLLDVRGIGPAKLEAIRDLVRV